MQQSYTFNQYYDKNVRASDQLELQMMCIATAKMFKIPVSEEEDEGGSICLIAFKIGDESFQKLLCYSLTEYIFSLKSSKVQ